jgi:hypothetical protein
MTILILEIVLSLSAVAMAILLIRASVRVEGISKEEIDQYSLHPHIKRVGNSLITAIYDFLISFFKGILHALASLSKQTHMVSTRSIARIERAISSAEEQQKNYTEEESKTEIVEEKRDLN